MRPKYLAASIACLCTAARLHAAHPVPETPAAYVPLNGSLSLELGFTADRVEGQTNLLAPLFRGADGKNMLFLDGNWSGKGDGNENGSVGLGFRHRFDQPDLILGLNAFYDYGDYSGRGYPQFGIGLELLTKWFDFRANGYFPEHTINRFDRSRDTTGHLSTGTGTSTSSSSRIIDGGEGNPDLLQTTTTTTTSTGTRGTLRRHRHRREEAPLTGFDLELGGLLPYVDCVAETRLYAGYVFFDEPWGNDISCFTARLESRPVRAIVFDVQYKGDSRLVDGENHWFFGARAEIPFDLGNLAHGESPFAGLADAFKPTGRCFQTDDKAPARNRMNEPITRNWRPTVSNRSVDRTRTEHFDNATTTTKTTVTAVPVQQPD